MKIRIPATAIFLLASALNPLRAQSFNIEFGAASSGPSSAYAAAGLPGYWNAIRADGGVGYPIKNLAGAPTSVSFSQSGAAGLLTDNDPSVSGDDALLLDSGLITHTYGVDSCFYFNGLTPGIYELSTYAWRPNNAALVARNFVDNTPGMELTGGAWPGHHVHGVTFARHIVVVGANGGMTSHSGLAAGSDTSVGAVCNGIQMRLLEYTPYCFGDGTSTACPCANVGAAGNGCANSVNAAGANLILSGSASVAGDTLVLQGSGMPSSSALYYQGSTQVSVVFGDGLRCVGGSVIRLGTKVNVGGASQFPSAGDPLVSTVGLDAVGSVRMYQCWYRNAATFCTSSTFNLSNAVQVTWLP